MSYKFNTTSGIGPVFETSPTPVTPLCLYNDVDMISYRQSEEDDTGITSEGYIKNWIASPRDVMDRSLYFDMVSEYQLWLSHEVSASSYSNLTVSFYTWLELGDTDTSVPLVHILESHGGSTTDALMLNASRSGNEYTFTLQEHTVTLVSGNPSPTASYSNIKMLVDVDDDFTNQTDIHGKWLHWNIHLGMNKISYQVMYNDTTPACDEYGEPFFYERVFSQVSGVTGMSKLYLLADNSAGNDGVTFYVDDLYVMSNGVKSLFHEDFSYGDIVEMMNTQETGWDTNKQSYIHLDASLETNINIGMSRSILDIDPYILSSYTSPDAQLEFFNGWYRAIYYNSTDYPYYFSGYDDEMLDYLTQRYYQHYITLIDVPETGSYRLTLEHPTGDDNRLVIVDQDDVQPDQSGIVDVYLRQGIHTLYLKMYGNGTDDVNAFRVKIAPNGFTPDEDIVSFVPRHGRMVAVYYDAAHSSRMRELESPSYYIDPAAVLDKASVLMATHALSGLKVLVDAQGLLDYMLRDINTGTYYNGHVYTPMFETAGSVIMSSDAVPDTIFMGENEGSIVEQYLERNGYLAMDGNVPFYVSTHADGSSTIWELGAEWVLDLDMDEAWYHPDDSTVTLNPLDAGGKELFQTTGSSPETWSSWARYDLVMPQTSSMATYQDALRVSIASQTHEIVGREDSESDDYMVPGMLVEQSEYDINGDLWWDVVGTYEEFEDQFLLAPGSMKVTFSLSLDDNIPFKWATHDTRINIVNAYIDGAKLSNKRRLSETYSNTMGEITETNAWTGSVPLGQVFYATFDFSDTDHLYDTFVDFLSMELWAVVEQPLVAYYEGSPYVAGTTTKQHNLRLHDIFIEKDFMVRTAYGVDEDYAFTLPMPEKGYLYSLRMPRIVLPHYVEDAQNVFVPQFVGHQRDDMFMTGSLCWDDHIKMNITDYQGNEVEYLNMMNYVDTGDTVERMDFKEYIGGTLPFVSRIDFQGNDRYVNPLNYRIHFDQQQTSTNKMLATPYYWQIKTPDGLMPSEIISGQMYKNWMLKLDVALRREALEGMYTTEIGRMIYGDLANYTPQWALSTAYLQQNNRAYLEYAAFEGDSADKWVNPVSFQADSEGGGILTYGISTLISREHAMNNASVSEAFMEYIARVNHMNMWGHTKVDDAVESTTLEYTVEDRVELMNQEGWIDELVARVA
ncbi:MAG: hypothetical protein ACXAEN_22630, partial [Candidatus Thorarchaeota archaeon]